MLSAFCVLAVALTSVIKHFISKTKFYTNSTLFLGIGAVIGGVLGQFLFNIVKNNSNQHILIIIQSICLILLLIFVIIYMLFMKGKDKYTLHIKNWLITLLIGVFLGLSSSFLGIGGGPINVAVLCLFFAMDMKSASINSLVIIIFTQSSKIIQSLIQNQLQTCNMDWVLLIILVCVAIVGSLVALCAREFYVDKIFLGTDGFEKDVGFMGSDMLRSEAIEKMSESAKHIIMMTDSSKFNKKGTIVQFKQYDISTLITDNDIPEDLVEYFKRYRVNVIEVNKEETK
jgi:uncharacterized membrane protein YfcA